MSTITRAAITGSSVKDGFVLEAPVLDEALQVDDDDLGGGHGHTSYLSRTSGLSVEQQISCGAILLHMEIFDGLVEQNRFT